MFKIKTLTAITLLPFTIIAQNLEKLSVLNNTIEESSGLVYLEGRLITHNDSGGEPKLYELDSLTGNVLREVEILNAVNTDWEDICYDNNYIYIGDFGNNTGSRTDLKIYRIPRQDYLDNNNNTVSAEVISFNYNDQIDFTSANLNTKYDAESVISLGDSLYIFTKNWVENRTYVYPIPKIIGNHTLIKTDSLDINGLVTGSDICEATGTIYLTAYTPFQSSIIVLTNYNNHLFLQGNVEVINLQVPANHSYQIEGVAVVSPHLIYITTEQNSTGSPALYKLDFTTNNIPDFKNEKISISPNPASSYISINTTQEVEVHIFDVFGKKIKSEKSKYIDISQLPVGIYTVNLVGLKSQFTSVQKIIIHR